MEGKINFYQNDKAGEKQPTYKGFIEIDGVVHTFAAWPAKSGKGWSGRYEPKKEYAKAVTEDTQKDLDKLYSAPSSVNIDDEIPF